MTAPKWRIAAGGLVLAALLLFGIELIPVYYHNWEFHKFVSEAAQRVENQTKSDDVLREWVVERASSLELPVKVEDVHIKRSPEGLRIDVRYIVRVNLPGYTVDLHFYPGAASD